MSFSQQSPPDPDDELPPIPDPFVGHGGQAPAVQPGPRSEVSTLAVTSVLVALLGPVGSLAAVVFGWAARREIKEAGSRRTGGGIALFGMVLGVVLTAGWAVVGTYLFRVVRDHVEQQLASPIDSPADLEPPVLAGPPAPVVRAEPTPGGNVPKKTVVHREGAITVVDVGVATSALEAELAKQRAEATTAGERLVVMTTRDDCEPCRGVDHALRDPLMQTALGKTRLVRVDVMVFEEDLDKQKIPHQEFPGFFLLSVDLTPKDGINGGEWDDDIAQNIAPVLGAFVRGKYATRRRSWHPLPSTGMRL